MVYLIFIGAIIALLVRRLTRKTCGAGVDPVQDFASRLPVTAASATTAVTSSALGRRGTL